MWLRAKLVEGGTKVEMCWGNDEGPYDPYVIGKAALDADALRVRQVLDEIAYWYQAKPANTLPGLLRKLAGEGAQLRWRIFHSPGSNATIDAVKSELTAEGTKHLTIVADPDLQIPWGLIAEGDLEDVGDVVDCDPRFWTNRYRLSLAFRAHHYRVPAGGSPAGVLAISAICRKTFAGVEAQFDRWAEMPLGLAFNREVFRDLIGKAKSGGREAVYHIFGHAQNRVIHIDDELIDLTKLQIYLENAKGIVLLNACETATGDLDNSFRSQLVNGDILGIVATESKVPRIPASQFSKKFQELFIQQRMSLGQTMQAIQMDKSFWPVGMMYSCYAPVDYRIC